MAVSGIPVILGWNHERQVGSAEITEAGNLVITVPGQQLVDELQRLATVEQIIGVSLGIEYRPAQRMED